VRYRWDTSSITDLNTVKAGLVENLANRLKVTETIARILVNRGVDTYEKAKRFFLPDFASLHDPFLMDGMHAAVDRVVRAIRGDSKERILVFGDYDVDGTTGAAMMAMFLRELGGDVIVHIPNRIQEGYGISKVGIDRAHRNGASLLIAVDCGITAVEQVDYARRLGVDVIICDHHEPGEQIPSAYAVLDPLKPVTNGLTYPFKHLSGCGVAFKLLQGIARVLGCEELPPKYLDFVALATAADIVPLIDENRTLVKLGLDVINSNPRPGIRALIETSGAHIGKIGTGQIVFVLAPRINAAGRLGDAHRAVELLMSESEDVAWQYANALEEENRNRRRIDEETFLNAQMLVETYLDFENDAAIVLHQEQWHPGVIGIVAARLVEKYYRPTIMMTTVDGVAKGSARSIAGFDIYQALKRVEDKMLQFGGHKYAAGLSVDLNRLDEFKEAFNQVVKELLPNELLTPELKIDAEVSFGELTPKFIRIIERFSPFGPQNMRPLFIARNVELIGEPRIVGRDHLKLKLRQNGLVFDAIGFKLGDRANEIDRLKRTLDIVFSIESGNEGLWKGSPSAAMSAHSSPNGAKSAMAQGTYNHGAGFQFNEFPQLKIKDLC